MIDAYVIHQENGDHLLTTEEAAAFQYVISRSLKFTCKPEDPFMERIARIEQRDFDMLMKVCEVRNPGRALDTARGHVIWADVMFKQIERVVV